LPCAPQALCTLAGQLSTKVLSLCKRLHFPARQNEPRSGSTVARFRVLPRKLLMRCRLQHLTPDDLLLPLSILIFPVHPLLLHRDKSSPYAESTLLQQQILSYCSHRSYPTDNHHSHHCSHRSQFINFEVLCSGLQCSLALREQLMRCSGQRPEPYMLGPEPYMLSPEP